MIKVLDKAARVLAALGAGEGDGVAATQLSRELGINKATLSHLLSSLVEIGYAWRREDGRYGLGSGLLELARDELQRETLAGQAESAARRLAAELGEMVTVATLHHGERHVLAKVSPQQSVTVDPRTEERRSPFGTATGRVLLAHAPDDDVAGALETQEFPLRRWPQVTSPEQLSQALAEIRAAGLVFDVTSDGQAAQLAVPVTDGDQVVLAIGASVPCYRLSEPRREQVIAQLRTAAVRLAAALSFYRHEESR